MQFTHKDAAERASQMATSRADILTNERALALVEHIENNLRRCLAENPNRWSPHYANYDMIRLAVKFLRQGYLYFSDLGISAWTQFSFIECGVMCATFKEDLMKSVELFEQAVREGITRQGSYKAVQQDILLSQVSRELNAEALP